tara:strand:- start:151 stop:426 length:276 start_codon:yes stop_codon:yes gene_type:complete
VLKFRALLADTAPATIHVLDREDRSGVPVKRTALLLPLAVLAEDTAPFRPRTRPANRGGWGLSWVPRSSTPVPTDARRIETPEDTEGREAA